jgi:hypothetical protein
LVKYHATVSYFSYPSFCVLTAEPVSFPSDEKTRALIAHNFAQLLMLKMPSVCGVPMLIDMLKTDSLPARTALATLNASNQRSIKDYMPTRKRLIDPVEDGLRNEVTVFVYSFPKNIL